MGDGGLLDACCCVLCRSVGCVRGDRSLGVTTMMRLRLWSKQHDGRFCSLCQSDALYVMEMRVAQPPFGATSHYTLLTRFCQSHIDEMRTMFGIDAQQFYPKEDADVE